MMDRKCENCIWSDKCHEEEACDGYEPAFLEEQEDIDVAAYNADIRMRYEYYQAIVTEQNK